MTRRLVLLGGILLSATGALPGCERVPPPSRPAASVRVRAFTETSAVRLLASAGPYLFAAAGRGLDRWEVTSGAVLPLSAAQGLPGDHVVALAVDAPRGWLWVVTDRGIAHYDVRAQTLVEVAAPPRGLGIDLADRAGVAAAADEGGLWLADRRGLFHLDLVGHWSSTAVVEPVTALHAGEDGLLWIGTAAGLISLAPDGTVARFGPDQGLAVTRVRVVTRAPGGGGGGGVLVLGEEPGGRPRVALRRGDGWVSYRVLPELRWTAAASVGGDVILLGDGGLGDGGLYRLAERPPGLRRPLSRDGWRLLPIAGDTAAALSLVVDRIDARLPAGAAAMAMHDGAIFVGTRDVGVARISLGGAAPVGWLRRSEMLADASTLTVACRRRDDCLLATGARQAWRWRGDGFDSTGPTDQIVLAVVRGGDGNVYGVHRGLDDESVTVSRIDGTTWTAITTIDTPGERPSVSFARFAPGGLLWIGVRRRDGVDDRPWGVATVDVTAGAIGYRRVGGAPLDAIRDDAARVPALPDSAVDAAFRDGEVWLATGDGAARVVGDDVSMWTAADGLPSARLRSVVVSPSGDVLVATRAGVARFDGERWLAPRELAFAVNDLAMGRDGRLWLATARGIAVYDGRRVRRVDVRRGLLENEIAEVVVDDYGRLWARGARSLAVISP